MIRRIRPGFTLIELLVVIAIIGVLIGLLMPAVQKARESANRATCISNLHNIGIALHNYHNTYGLFPPGYVDGNTDANSTPDNDVGPGWGWASFLLPFVEQNTLYQQINFSQNVGMGVNADVSVQPLKMFQCPADPLQQSFSVYDSTFTTPIATVAHSNYVGCNGWEECFSNAGGNAQGAGSDGLAGGFGQSGDGLFYRNSQYTMANITDGLSNTIVVGERSSNHSPSTWVGAIPQGRCPAWMAGQTVYSPPPGPAYDNADWGEAFVLAHGNATHLPSADYPLFDPDTFYSMHTGNGANFLFADVSVHFLTSSIDRTTYQHLCTIAGGEVTNDW